LFCFGFGFGEEGEGGNCLGVSGDEGQWERAHAANKHLPRPSTDTTKHEQRALVTLLSSQMSVTLSVVSAACISMLVDTSRVEVGTLPPCCCCCCSFGGGGAMLCAAEAARSTAIIINAMIAMLLLLCAMFWAIYARRFGGRVKNEKYPRIFWYEVEYDTSIRFTTHK
jgi:hypothetical protein